MHHSDFYGAQRILKSHSVPVSKAIFPLSEPLGLPDKERNHWSTAVIDFSRNEVVYINSIKSHRYYRDFLEARSLETRRDHFD